MESENALRLGNTKDIPLIFGNEDIMESFEATVRKSPKLWMVAFYLFFVAAFLYVKPAMAFGKDGNVRPFGVAKREATVFPLWLWMLGLAMVSYLLVVWILDFDF